MKMRTVKLIDQAQNTVAIGQVSDEGDHFGGTIDLRGAPSNVRSLFDEFEEVVNGQMFSFLDEIQDRIAALPIKVVLGDRGEVHVKDLQVFPSTGALSFKLAATPASSLKSA